MMKCSITPSLEHLAIVKITTFLWNQNDIRALIENYHPFASFCAGVGNTVAAQKWQKIEDKVLEKVSYLQQPEPIKEKIGGVVRPIGLEILKWRQQWEYNGFDCSIQNFLVNLPSEFFFTQLGRINMKMSAELLIKEGENLSTQEKYRLACLYCLEDYLPDLWNNLSKRSKRYFNMNIPNRLTTETLETDTYIQPMVFFTYSLKGEFAKATFRFRQSFYVHQLKQAICDDDITAVEYFYKKMTLNDSQSLIPEATETAIGKDTLDKISLDKTDNLVEIVFFLLSKMSEEDQIRVLSSSKVLNKVLLAMLDWPWQCFFIETITLMRSFIPQSVYEELLEKIISKVIDGYKDYCYRDIFIKLCLQIPEEERHHMLHKVCASGSLIANLFKIKDGESIKLIFPDATPQLKTEFIESSNGRRICCKLMARGERNLLELLLLECIPTKDERVEFEKILIAFEELNLKITAGFTESASLFEALNCKNDKRKRKNK